jgi:hypothetical protein
LIFICFCNCEAKEYKYSLSISAIFQNEDRFLDEWISYHMSIGVEHFWLYNNNSTDEYQKVLEKYIDYGIVELIDWPSKLSTNEWINFSFVTQVNAYNDAIEKSRGLTKWLAIIDTDEFIFCPRKPLKKILHKYANEQAIALKWVCFGTSGIEFCVSGEMLSKLTKRLPLNHPKNNWYKSIVRPEKVITCNNPHYCLMEKGKEKVLEISECRINHYWTRDEKFLREIKIPRHEKWGGNRAEILEKANEMNQEFDDSIVKNFNLFN